MLKMFCFWINMYFSFCTPQFINLEPGKLLVSSCSLLAKRLDCYKVRGFKTLPSTHPYNVFVTYSLLEGSIMNWIHPLNEEAIGNVATLIYSRWPSTVLTRWSSSTTPWDTPASRAMPTTCASDLTSSLQCCCFQGNKFSSHDSRPLIFHEWGVKILWSASGFHFSMIVKYWDTKCYCVF